MPAGTLESFKTAFLPTLSRAFDERLKALEAPLLALGDQVTLLGRLAHPELDRHQRSLEEASSAAQDLRELAKTSVFEATAGVADLEDQVHQSGQTAALAITSRKADLLQKARQAVTALEKDPASAWLANDVLPGLKQQLSEGEKALDSDPAEGARVLGGLPTATVKALEQPAKKLEYEQRKLGVEQALQALKAHLQRAHVAAEISRAETDLLASTNAAKANKPMDANLKLGSASQACKSALPLADRYAQYRVQRA